MVMGDPLPLWLSCLSVVPVAAASVASGGRRSTTPARALPGVLQHDALIQQLLAYGVGPVELPALLGLLSLLDQGLDGLAGQACAGLQKGLGALLQQPEPAGQGPQDAGSLPGLLAAAGVELPHQFKQHRQGLGGVEIIAHGGHIALAPGADRKSTRLNSSHVAISYAVF